jgi:[acyl-carrier-protein] S-malonyltransferase
MQEALPPGEGGMAALLGGNDASLDKLLHEASQGKVLEVANMNAPGQVVLSGHDEAINRAVIMAKKLGFMKAVKLQVSAPFHCSLMAPVREKFAPELKETKFMPPICPIIHNVSAQPNNDPLRMADLLARQVDNPVRWVESIQYLLNQDVKIFVEIGHGKVLQGLVKKIAGKDFDGIITGYSSQKDSERILDELKDIKISEGGFDISDIRTRMQEDLIKELESYGANGSDSNGGTDV